MVRKLTNKQTMQYNHDLALRLQAKYGLGGSTIRTWKSTNHIPNKYADPDYVRPVAASKKELAELRKYLELPYLRETQAEYPIPRFRFQDFKKGTKDALINKGEIKKVKEALKPVRKRLKQFIKEPASKQLQQVLKERLVIQKRIIEDAKIMNKINDKSFHTINEVEWAYLKERFEKILEELPFIPTRLLK